VPDVYIRNEKLEEEMDFLRNELDKAKIITEKAKYIFHFFLSGSTNRFFINNLLEEPMIN